MEVTEATRVGRLLDNFVGEQLPDVEVLSAVRELREQFRIRQLNKSEKVVAKKPYPGRRSGIDPVEFLLENYGDEIRSGRLGPGRLHRLDAGLYTSVHDRLDAATTPCSVADFFAAQMGEGKSQNIVVRRTHVLATILGTDDDTASRFLSSIRPDRLLSRNKISIIR